MIKGSCHCGAVAFSVRQFSGPIAHCHCHTCRKTHSAAYATTAGVARADFVWTTGQDVLRHYESSPGKIRHFCGNCGAHLMAEWLERDTVILRLGVLDDDPGERPEVHIWVSHDVPWMEYRPRIRQLTEGMGSVEAVMQE
jgi:hypothetical protein